MNTEHSPELWVEGHNVSHEPTIRSANPDKDNGGFVIATFHGPRSKVNANRVVACVNACEGIDTYTLEGFSRRYLAGLAAPEAAQHLHTNLESVPHPFTRDELYDLGQAVDNLIQDRNDYCATEDGNAEFVKRLQALLGKVEGVLGAHYQR